MASSADPGPVYFWKESDPEAGYLSQWYYCPFRDDKDERIRYKTAEHYMMFQKAMLFKDEHTAIEVLKAATPRKVKALGRKVKNFNEATWLKHRCDIVRHGNILKFTRAISEKGYKKGSPSGNPLEGSLLDTLLRTGDRELVEASPFDPVWGIGFKAADAEAARGSWGENLLGKELMAVRSILRKKRDQGQL
ncbi:unnamed protein product [Fusarium graminearum]|nr:hypothetical protein FGSG_02760 [Fusarium graminearum PH-1]ESU08241.1 hypothetical protein FGSG_02760 [Fusarium graminearum PH-1]EYB21813.1 hypothetical protein FG05_02760 [Fusarium graminearum]PCD36549.1 hypothetical protein FGRA07_08433 [Fusarium graminearum]CZS78397.1 unnamed protein product [Fusarium graminearum]|eukprot:XP_011318726.1 hypothetical protein FGSG_02760 [Fusarium graminearum PH-1]